MGLLTLYNLALYGFINKQIDKPIWVRKGYGTDSQYQFNGIKIVLIMQFSLIAAEESLKLIDKTVLVLALTSLVLIGHRAMKPLLDKYKQAYQQYREDVEKSMTYRAKH